jgi:putative nucleotidyltransferase with HDIG domain
MSPLSFPEVQRRVAELDRIPTVPALLMPLLKLLGQPAEEVNVNQMVGLIAHDKSLSAQCLQMANSPLFGMRQRVDSVHAAVVAIGIRRVREMATTCCLIRALPRPGGGIRPDSLWKHSLGCALASRQLATKIGFKDAEQAYLAGLLHDVGLIVELTLFPKEFDAALQLAAEKGRLLHEVEREVLGTNHCVVGALLADKWSLPPEMKEAIRYHHVLENTCKHRTLVSIVHLSDLLCRFCGLGYGFAEFRQLDLQSEPSWQYIAEDLPQVRSFDLARFTLEMDDCLEEIEQLVASLFNIQ